MSADQPLINSGASRRRFLQAGVSIGAASFGFPAIVSCQSPGSKMNIAVIGVGGRGASNLKKVSEENVVALCDVNAVNLASAKQQHSKAKTFKDFRSLYDNLKEGEFDAVVVSTTEHTHAFATLPALQQ